MKAVMWTDAFQILLMFAAVISLVVEGFSIVGKDEVMKRNIDGNRIEFFNFDPNPLQRHTFWTLLFGGYFTWIAVYGVNQAQVQRCLTVATLKKAQIALWINAVGLVALYIVLGISGLIMYAYYVNCDPLRNKKIQASDQLIPYFVMEVLGKYPGLPGLFVSGLFSGTLSTISSGVNSLAAIVLEDVIKPYIWKSLTEAQATKVSKILALVGGLLCIALAFLAGLLGNILQAALSIFGMIGGPLLGVFSLGMIFPWINPKGALVGLISGLVIILWIGIGAQIYKPFIASLPVSIEGCISNYTEFNISSISNSSSIIEINISSDIYNSSITEFNISSYIYNSSSITEFSTLSSSSIPEFSSSSSIYNNSSLTSNNGNDHILAIYRLSYLWYSGLSCMVVIIIAHIVTFCTGKTNGSDLDPRLIFPLFYKLGFFLPSKVRQKLIYGIKYSGEYGVYAKEKIIPANESGSINPAFIEELDQKLTANHLNGRTAIDSNEHKNKNLSLRIDANSNPTTEMTKL